MTAFFFLQTGHAGLGALIAHEGPKYEFSDSFLGLLVAATYTGFFAGNNAVRYLLPRVSYIRTFSVCAAMITVWVLLLPMLPGEISWILLRFLHGVFFSACVVLSEGWLNSTVDNKNRGKAYGMYMVISYAAVGISQYILVVAESIGSAAFSAIGMIVVFSLVPLCLTRVPEPQTAAESEKKSAALSFLQAYRIAPVSFICLFITGAIQGSSWLFVRYAEGVADNTDMVSFLAMLFFISGVALQMPLGWLADKVKDRRSVMSGVYLTSATSAFLLFFGEHFPLSLLTTLIILYGAVSVTSFSLSIAYGQSFITNTEQTTEYVGRVYQVYALGALIGPVTSGYLMDVFSLAWLFGFCFLACAAAASITLTSIIMPKRKPLTKEIDIVQPLSLDLPSLATDTPSYNELEIGPALPDDTPLTKADDTEVGPVLPDAPPLADAAVQEVGPALPEDWYSEDTGTDFVGPAPVDK